jgi:PAS domain S-box-containing protein
MVASGLAEAAEAGLKLPRNRIDSQAQFAFCLAIAILLIVGAISYRSTIVSVEGNQWVEHTRDVRQSLRELLIAVLQAQAGNQGYILTGEPSYVSDSQSATAAAHRKVAEISLMTADNPDQQAPLQRIDDLLTAEAEVVRSPPVPGHRPGIIREITTVIGQMMAIEQHLLDDRMAEVAREQDETRAILVLGTCIGLGITAAAGWGVTRDAARRGLAEAALRDAEEQYRMLLYEVDDYSVVTLDTEGRVLTANSGAERIGGYAAAEIVGQPFSRLFSPELLATGWPDEVLALTASRGRYEEKGRRQRKDGTPFMAHVSYTALRDRSGALRGFSLIGRDLSETQESVAKYRGLLEAAPDAMVVVDQAGAIVLLNLQAAQRFGYESHELVGQMVTKIIPTGFAERLLADGTRTADEALAQQIGTGIELIGRRKNGSEFPIELMLSPLKNAEGTLVTAAIRDISIRRDAETHLAKKLAELSRSNEELAQFAYLASHDLQEPLRMVASYTQLLSRRYKGKLDADADEFIAYAVDGATRMQQLIRDLLAYSRLGTAGGDIVDTAAEDALASALFNLRGAIEESGARITHDTLPAVRADRSQLVQLFQNLIGNAIKYQKSGTPLVHISVERDGAKGWMFSVRDNGLGIDPKYFDRIFGMFQRLHKREEFAGTGIGLALCKKIVERHGGTISVESTPGEGSVFRFSLGEATGAA